MSSVKTPPSRRRQSPPQQPRYVRIRTFVRDNIANGAFKPGDRLPSEQELAKRFDTTRATVVHALQPLVYEGAIIREPGRGTFVAPRSLKVIQEPSRIRSFEEQVEEQGGHITFRLVSFSRVVAPTDVAEKLGLKDGSEVYNLLRVRLVEAIPAVVESRYLPLAIGERMTVSALTQHSMYKILAEEVGRPVLRIDGIIRAAAAHGEIASHLQIGEGAPVLLREYVLTGVDGTTLACGSAIFREQVQIAYSVEDRNIRDA